MKFEWDEKKNKLNIEKHNVSFNEAKTVFMMKLDDMEIPELTAEDFKKMRKNPYANMFTPEEKFRAYVEAFMADYGWDKEYVKKEVDLASV